jgi:hypothetical protein
MARWCAARVAHAGARAPHRDTADSDLAARAWRAARAALGMSWLS